MADGGLSEPCTTSGPFCEKSVRLRDCKDGFAETVVDCASQGQMCSYNRCVDPTAASQPAAETPFGITCRFGASAFT